MVDLMVDMELAEAYSNVSFSGGADARIEMGRRVLEKHGVSEETLDTTLAWYGRNLDTYTQLFDKVDKELMKRRKHYTEVPGEKVKEADNLWPYNTHLVISPLSGYESMSFSLKKPEIKKGDIVEFSLFLPNATAVKNTLGVEYSDGSGEATVATFSSSHEVKVLLQTDTAKKIERLYGVLNVNNARALPLYIDSISIKTLPLDTLEYRSNQRNQRSYFTMLPQKKPEKNEETDSIDKKENGIEVATEILEPGKAPAPQELKRIDGKQPGRPSHSVNTLEKMKK